MNATKVQPYNKQNQERKGGHSWFFPARVPWRHLSLLLGGMLWVLTPMFLQAQRDDFDDGNDDNWTRYDPIAESGVFPGVGIWTFPDGNKYRIQTDVSPLPGTVGPGRAGSLRQDVTYTDFYMTVDVVAWETNLDQAIGLLARISDVGLGSSDGYALTYQVMDGDIDITRITDEDPAGGELPLDGDDVVNMVPGHQYRLVFIGVGPNLRALVYDLADMRYPVVEVLATDATYSSGYCGIVNFDNSGGGGTTDATYDNYLALEREPPRVSISLSAFQDLIISWPTNSADFTLQGSPSLDAPEWTDIVAPPYPELDFGGGFFIYTGDFVTDQAMKFYRLIRQ